jgi:hypothetical protein
MAAASLRVEACVGSAGNIALHTSMSGHLWNGAIARQSGRSLDKLALAAACFSHGEQGAKVDSFGSKTIMSEPSKNACRPPKSTQPDTRIDQEIKG